MKSLKQIIFMLTVVIGLGLNISAQVQADDQKRPPKEKPPVIDPKQKLPRENPPPKGGDKPKKPGSAYNFV